MHRHPGGRTRAKSGRGRGLQELGLDKLLLGVWRCRRLQSRAACVGMARRNWRPGNLAELLAEPAVATAW
jgi:hypothetical protein